MSVTQGFFEVHFSYTDIIYSIMKLILLLMGQDNIKNNACNTLLCIIQGCIILYEFEYFSFSN